MTDIKRKLSTLNWQDITSQMNESGFAIVPKVLSGTMCKDLVKCYDITGLYRKTVVMERHGYGFGEYKYFQYPLPSLVQSARETLYPKLAPIANGWMNMLNMDTRFPGSFKEMQKLCHQNNQLKPTALILKYGKGGYNTLHQDLYGDVFFPIQVVFFLNEPGKDFMGGEFVLVQQVIRAQSKAIVLKPGKGDMLIFTTRFRPVKGKRGYYRAAMKHGVSEIQEGERHTLGIIFHDALK